MHQVKCKFCDNYGDKEKMIRIDNKNVHKDCLDEYKKDVEFKKSEDKELNYLVNCIKKLHKIESIPNQFYPSLQDLRNGNQRRGKIIGDKKYKKGYSYKIIATTYIASRNQIAYSLKTKKFTGTNNMLRYTYAIVVDQIDGINNKIKEKEYLRKQDTQTEKDSAIRVERMRGTEYKYKKQKNNGISDLID